MFPVALWLAKRGLGSSFRAFGSSMDPIIKSGQRLRVEPVDPDRLEVGDAVMVEVNGSSMLHLVRAIDEEGRRVEIAGTGDEVNGWTPFDCVYAICTRIDGEPVPGASAKTRARRRFAWRGVEDAPRP
jgi:hypothetical protein